jgi:integrase
MTTPVKKLQGTIFKKCDMAAHKPESNKACAAGTCQHTCTAPDKCPHAWTLRYFVNGKQKEESFRDDMDAKKRVRYGTGLKKAQDAQLELTRGKRAEGQTYIAPTGGKDNFGKACEAFIAAMACADNTRLTYLGAYSTWVKPAMGHLTLAQAANAHDTAEKLITVKMAHLSPVRRRTARLLVTGVLDKAVKTGKIALHRVTDIEIADNGRPMRGEFTFPSFAQVAYLADEIGIAVWLMRGCGLRISEALAVEKSDFRDGGRTLRVSGQASRDGRKKAALKHRKLGEYRDVPVPAWLWGKVKDLPDGPLCPGNGRPYAVYSTVDGQFVKHVPRAGIPAGFTPHSLRHLYASVMLVEGGIDITEVARFLGHKDINETYRTYGHLLPNANDKAIAALDAEFERWSKEGEQE